MLCRFSVLRTIPSQWSRRESAAKRKDAAPIQGSLPFKKQKAAAPKRPHLELAKVRSSTDTEPGAVCIRERWNSGACCKQLSGVLVKSSRRKLMKFLGMASSNLTGLPSGIRCIQPHLNHPPSNRQHPIEYSRILTIPPPRQQKNSRVHLQGFHVSPTQKQQSCRSTTVVRARTLL